MKFLYRMFSKSDHNTRGLRGDSKIYFFTLSVNPTFGGGGFHQIDVMKYTFLCDMEKIYNELAIKKHK